MATPNWHKHRKGKQGYDDNVYKLNPNKSNEENIIDIINGLYIQSSSENEPSPSQKQYVEYRGAFGARTLSRSVSDNRKISYLNALHTILSKDDSNKELGFTTEELMVCLRINLVDESILIRATALRILRYLIKTESDVIVFNTLRLPFLVVRSMDLMLRNEEERAQALRVVRRVVAVVATSRSQRAYVDFGLLQCLSSVARAGNAGEGTGDRLARPAIATLAEIGIMDPALFIACGGVSAVSRYVQECATPRMAEALCGTLLYMLDRPATRRAARVDLRCLCAPYCDLQQRHANDKTRDERELRFMSSRLALLCVLRSWPGVVHFCHPLSEGGLRSLVHALHLQRLEVRKAILDLLYELLGLPQPEWTDEISVALTAMDPADFQDSWRLNEGFVAAEGCAILPHLNETGPDIADIHLALLIYCFLEAGLLDGLAEVIVTSDTFISVRATMLLGQLLHLIHMLIPPELCNISPPLPTLLSHASKGKPQALAAIAALRKLQAILEDRPATNSLFLDHIVQYCSGNHLDRNDTTKAQKEKENNMALPRSKKDSITEDSLEFLNDFDYEQEMTHRHSLGSKTDYSNKNEPALVKSQSVSSRSSVSKVAKTRFLNLFEKEGDSFIRLSLVMQNKDGNTWDWEIIRSVLKDRDGKSALNLNDSGHRAWVGRIVDYLRPSSNKYSHTELGTASHGYAATRAACQLVSILLPQPDMESRRLLTELFVDVNKHVRAILEARSVHECLFSPQHMCNTMCQMYFLLVGQLCQTRDGLQLFHDTGLYQSLLELATTTYHSCYVKLVISSLDYTLDSYPRDILAKTLVNDVEASRLYATQFLNVLLRATHKSGELLRKRMRVRTKTTRARQSPAKDTSDMARWALRLLVAQIKDESKTVAKCALLILEEACAVPGYFKYLVSSRDSVRENCGISAGSDVADTGTAGDKGYLLWLRLQVGAGCHASEPLLRKHLDFWTTSYNYRYSVVVEAETHEALTLAGASAGVGSGDGDDARGRTGAGRKQARPPTHIHAALAAHASTAHLLLPTLPQHYTTIKQGLVESESGALAVKAALWALGGTGSCGRGLDMLAQLAPPGEGVLACVVRLARACPVYSVKATAFYVLAMIGATHAGADHLNDLGWLCVRHTYSDRFPIISEEYRGSRADGCDELRRQLNSPRRFHASRHYPEPEPSEHSDQTDHSTAESLHSDQTRPSKASAIIERLHADELSQRESRSPLNEPERKLKSQTLPQRNRYPVLHERSFLSESKTVDVLRESAVGRMDKLFAGKLSMLDHTQEGRIRNTSESSTSGVSSCESVPWKYALPDRVLTLSPIPSSSSLFGMRGPAPLPKRTEPHRRISMSSYQGSDVPSSPPSQRDMIGYETLKLLNKHRRPTQSEGSSETPELDEINWILCDNPRRYKPFSSLRAVRTSTLEDRHRISLLKYDWKPLSRTELRERERVESVSSVESPPIPTTPPPGPCYIGICLPLNLLDLFPSVEELALENSAALGRQEALRWEVGGGGGVDAPWGRHSPANCLACVPTRPPSSLELKEAFLTGVEVGGMAPCRGWAGWSSVGTAPGSGVGAGSEGGYSGAGAAGAQWSGGGAGSLPPSCSPASLDSTLAEPRHTPAVILSHARHMANPLHLKQSKPALLALKQRHPDSFQSVCLYSEVCALLASSTYILNARRFLQELFLDASFECFASEPQAVLARHLSPRPLTAPASSISPPK